MQQNFSESVKPRAETFSRSAIICFTTECTSGKIVPQGRRIPHMRGIFSHPGRGGAPRRGKGSKISPKKAISQTEPPAAEKMPGSTPPPTRAASPPTPSGQHSALRSGSIAGTPSGLHAAASGQHRRQPFRAALSAPLGLHRRHTSRGCTPPPPSGGRTPTYSAMAWR